MGIVHKYMAENKKYGGMTYFCIRVINIHISCKVLNGKPGNIWQTCEYLANLKINWTGGPEIFDKPIKYLM